MADQILRAHHSIVEKLYTELQRPLETEMQVVYILVELRKLMELSNKKSEYQAELL
jgi:hypothetical protein